MTVILRPRVGAARRMRLEDWTARATVAEHGLLGRLEGPVLDLGCGPGRLVVALAEQGTAALGVDTSPAAVSQSLERGAPVLCRSIFDPVPAEGRWRSVLLFDGNIGIGGDPTRLLQRAAELVGPGGSVLVEVDPPGSTTALTEARLDVHGTVGPWFPWAWVAVERLADFALAAGFAVIEWLRPDGRWIARLQALDAP